MVWGGVTALVTIAGCAQIPAITGSNTPPATTALAEHLTQTGAKMYGTYWCPYCERQEQMFGDAITKVQVIECDPQGDKAQPQLCTQAKVSSFPTWEINGQLYEGLRSLDDLATISNYQGSREFNP